MGREKLEMAGVLLKREGKKKNKSVAGEVKLGLVLYIQTHMERGRGGGKVEKKGK